MSQSYYTKGEASSAGAVLAAAREELNLSVADAARHLKLSPAQVEALEQGAYDRLPGRVFVRGFLRNYAKLLGLDPEPLLRRIEHEMPQPRRVEEPPPAPEAVMPTGERSRWPLYTGIAGTIIAALAAYEFGFNSPSSEDEPTAGANPGAEQTAGAPSSVTAAAQGSTTSATSDSNPGAAPPGLESQTAPSGTARAGGALDPTASASGSSQGAPPGTGERELHFRFEQESWVEIRDRNDKVIFTRLNPAGTEQRIAGTPPFKLVVGNARGVRLTYHDQPVDLAPHTGVSVARLTLQ